MSGRTQVFRLPDLGEGLTEAEVVAWHVAVGDAVGVDQEVVTVETAKASVDVPCPFAGAVAELHAQPGTVLAVGSPLITIADGEQALNGSARSGRPGEADDADAAERYRSEERAGSTPPTGSPERPLIGYGAGEGPERRGGGRRHRHRATSPSTPTPPDTPGGPLLTPPDTSNGPLPTPPDTPNGPLPTPPDTPNGERRAVRVISPLVRTLAREWGIDLTTVRPGTTGVIRRADLEAARLQPPQVSGDTEEQPPQVPGGTEIQPPQVSGGAGRGPLQVSGGEVRVPIQGVQRLMVERLTTSRREIPDATTWVDVDATRLLRARDRLKQAHPELAVGVLALLARITVAGLTAYPALNSSVDAAAGEVVHHGAVNLGFAAQSPRGLVVPVVHGAQAMTTAELAAALRELTARARDGRLSPTELTGGTFTLNNYGVFGVDGSTPIINHPEAAMLGIGRIVDKPWVHKGRLRVRKVTQLSFTFDHRVCDGATAGGFLRFVADRVEQPMVLLAEL